MPFSTNTRSIKKLCSCLWRMIFPPPLHGSPVNGNNPWRNIAAWVLCEETVPEAVNFRESLAYFCIFLFHSRRVSKSPSDPNELKNWNTKINLAYIIIRTTRSNTVINLNKSWHEGILYDFIVKYNIPRNFSHLSNLAERMTSSCFGNSDVTA